MPTNRTSRKTAFSYFRETCAEGARHLHPEPFRLPDGENISPVFRRTIGGYREQRES